MFGTFSGLHPGHLKFIVLVGGEPGFFFIFPINCSALDHSATEPRAEN